MTAPQFDGEQACAGIDTATFFPAKGGNGAHAKTICRTCVHRDPCLEYALTVPVETGMWVDGVWAGTTTNDRARIRRAREQRGVA